MRRLNKHHFISELICIIIIIIIIIIWLIATRNTYKTLQCSVSPPATVLPLDVFLLLMQFVNLQIFLEIRA
jgi:hypothetical protein